MRIATMAAAVAVATAVGMTGLAGAALASASPATARLGTPQRLEDGSVVSSWSVSHLQSSNDVVNVPLTGRLWEATASVTAVQGTVTPAIPFFNARSASGDNYRVLYQAFAPKGLSGATLAQGGQSTGKIYFDVTGPQPTEVVYNDAVQDRLLWD
jgi:Domain of unknown function (DUF1942)